MSIYGGLDVSDKLITCKVNSHGLLHVDKGHLNKNLLAFLNA